MCVEMCADMCADMCVNICVNVCGYMCVDMCAELQLRGHGATDQGRTHEHYAEHMAGVWR